MNPTTIDERTWFYVEKKGIFFIHEIYEKGEYIKTISIMFPNQLIDCLNENKNHRNEILKYIPSLLIN